MSIASRLGGLTGSIGSTVLTRYKADVTDHKRKLKDLSGAQKKQQKQQIETLQKQNDALDVNIAKIGKVALAVGAIGAAYVGAQRAQAAFARDAQLRHAATGISIDRMKKAAGGLISELELMQLAAAGMNNEFGTTQQNLEDVVRLAVDLDRQGNDLTEVIKALTKSMAEGGSEELQKFGLRIADINDVLAPKGQRGFNALMKEASKVSSEFAHVAGDEAAAAAVTMKDATRDLMVALGSMANSVLPGLVGALTDVVSALNFVISGFKELADIPSQFRSGTALNLSGLSAERQALESMRDSLRGANVTDPKILAEFNRRWADLLKREAAFNQGLNPAAAAGLHTPGGVITHTPNNFQGRVGLSPDLLKAGGKAGPTKDEILAAIMEGLFAPTLGSKLPFPEISIGPEGSIAGGAFDPLAAIGGPGIPEATKQMEDFSASAVQAAGIASDAFGSMGSAAGMMWGAIITGADRSGMSVKKAFGEMLLGQSINLFGVGVTEGVMALASLASPVFGNPAIHAKASGVAFAGAATLGGLARILGATGSMPGGAGGGGAGSFRIGAGGGDQNINKTFFIGDSFFDRSPRQRAAKMAELISSEATSDGVEFV